MKITKRQLRKMILEHVDHPSITGDEYVELPDHAASTLQVFGGLDSVLADSELTTQFIELVLSVDEGRAQSLQYFLKMYSSELPSFYQKLSKAQNDLGRAKKDAQVYSWDDNYYGRMAREYVDEVEDRIKSIKQGARINNLRRIIIALRSQGER